MTAVGPPLPSTGVSLVPASAGSGSVTSVDVSGDTTGLTTSGGPVTTSGTITLGGTLNQAHGGTGAATLLAALTTVINALPTSLPGSAGVLWNNGGVISVS